MKKTTDLVLDASRAPSTGTTSAKENIGEMENKGLEFQVDGMLVQRNDFYWQDCGYRKYEPEPDLENKQRLEESE